MPLQLPVTLLWYDAVQLVLLLLLMATMVIVLRKISSMSERVSTVEAFVNEIRQNHLPHIYAKLESIEEFLRTLHDG